MRTVTAITWSALAVAVAGCGRRAQSTAALCASFDQRYELAIGRRLALHLKAETNLEKLKMVVLTEMPGPELVHQDELPVGSVRSLECFLQGIRMVYGGSTFEMLTLKAPRAIRERAIDRLKHVGEEGASSDDLVGVANMLVTWQEIDAELLSHLDCTVVVLYRLAPLETDGLGAMRFWTRPDRPRLALVHMSPFGLRQPILDGRITCVIQNNTATIWPGRDFFKKDLDAVFDMQYLMFTKDNAADPNYIGFLGEIEKEANEQVHGTANRRP